MVEGDDSLSPFTLSIEAATGIDTGISAADRARTVRVAVDARAKPLIWCSLVIFSPSLPRGACSPAPHRRGGDGLGNPCRTAAIGGVHGSIG